MQVTLEVLSTFLSFLSIVVVPALGVFYYKLNKLETHHTLLIKMIESLKTWSDLNDEQLNKNWLQFYNNEIIRFNERIKNKPEYVPTPEHYKSVFENYNRYKELGGNGYIDAIMLNVQQLYKIHYGFEYKHRQNKEDL